MIPAVQPNPSLLAPVVGRSGAGPTVPNGHKADRGRLRGSSDLPKDRSAGQPPRLRAVPHTGPGPDGRMLRVIGTRPSPRQMEVLMTNRRELIADRLEQSRFPLSLVLAATVIAANLASAVMSLVLAG